MISILFFFHNSVLTRRCTTPATVKGIDFEKGMVLAIDVLSIHFDQELWGPEDPYVFCPERHCPDRKRNPASDLTFGYGPRSKYISFISSFRSYLIFFKLFLKSMCWTALRLAGAQA